MSNNSDNRILKSLQGEGDVLFDCKFYCIHKDGQLLLALPGCRELALMTLALYQPQTKKAICLTAIIKWLAIIGVHKWIIPGKELTFRSKGPLSQLKPLGSAIGLLLGNPESEARRVIMLRETGEGVLVDKVGLTAEAKKTVFVESDIIRSLPRNTMGLLSLKDSQSHESWSSYSNFLVEGKSPRKRDDDLVLDILIAWMNGAEMRPLRDTEQWQAARKFVDASEHSVTSAVPGEKGDLLVKVGIYHGDFAPWNIKITPEGKAVVLDWEHGALYGPAGWDWFHYLIQRAKLVDHLPDKEVLDVCRNWAESPMGTKFLQEAGWGDDIEFCIGTYLAYSSSTGRFNHDSLLSLWIGQ